MQSRDDFEVARRYLNMVSKKPGTTAVTQNKIAAGQYDLTIIIPCYNEEKYIGQCLDSVKGQSSRYKIQTIVINDGSTDNTADILKKYEDLQDIKIIHQENGGFSGARNRGLKEVKSKYVFFLDADDYLLENTLEAMLDVAEKYQADMTEAQILNLVDGQLFREKAPIAESKEASMKELSGYVCGKMIRTELFQEVCFPEQYWYEDTIMAYLIYPRCKKAVLYNQDVYVYRRNPEGITLRSQNQKKSIDTYWITELMLEDMGKLHIEMNQDLYELLLNQIALNYVRTENQETNVKVAIYMLTAEWFEELHAQYTTTSKFQSILEKAFSVQDYNLYKTGCLLLWNKLTKF